jgi:hypothetical protein
MGKNVSSRVKPHSEFGFWNSSLKLSNLLAGDPSSGQIDGFFWNPNFLPKHERCAIWKVAFQVKSFSERLHNTQAFKTSNMSEASPFAIWISFPLIAESNNQMQRTADSQTFLMPAWVSDVPQRRSIRRPQVLSWLESIQSATSTITTPQSCLNGSSLFISVESRELHSAFAFWLSHHAYLDVLQGCHLNHWLSKKRTNSRSRQFQDKRKIAKATPSSQ